MTGAMRQVPLLAVAVLASCQPGAAREIADVASAAEAGRRVEGEAERGETADGGAAPTEPAHDERGVLLGPPRADGRASTLGAPARARLPLDLSYRFHQLGVVAGLGRELWALARDEGTRLVAFDREGRSRLGGSLDLGSPLLAERCGDGLVVVGLVGGGDERAGCGPGGRAVLAGLAADGTVAWRRELESAPTGLVCAVGEATPRLYWAERAPGCPAPTSPTSSFRWAEVSDGGGLDARGEVGIPHHGGLEALWVDGGWTAASIARGPGELDLLRIGPSGVEARASVATGAAGVALAFVDGRYAVLWADGEGTVGLRWLTRDLALAGEVLEVFAMPPDASQTRVRALRLLASSGSDLAVLVDLEQLVGRRRLRAGGCVPMHRYQCRVALYDWSSGRLAPAGVDHPGPCAGDWVGDELFLFTDDALLRYPLARGAR